MAGIVPYTTIEINNSVMTGQHTVYGLIKYGTMMFIYTKLLKSCAAPILILIHIVLTIAFVKADQSNMKICTNFSPMNRDQPD